jgi:hypothetical protein
MGLRRDFQPFREPSFLIALAAVLAMFGGMTAVIIMAVTTG